MKTLPTACQSYDRDKFKLGARRGHERRRHVRHLQAAARTPTFQDGTPVTAKDVKWSLDRAVTVGGFPTFQMSGRLARPSPSSSSSSTTTPCRVDFLRKGPPDHPGSRGDRAVRSSTPSWSRRTPPRRTPGASSTPSTNTAGGGAYRVTQLDTPAPRSSSSATTTGTSGPLPKVKRIVWRMVPSAGNRRALLERGDADISVRAAEQGLRRAEARPASSTIVSTLDRQRHPATSA